MKSRLLLGPCVYCTLPHFLMYSLFNISSSEILGSTRVYPPLGTTGSLAERFRVVIVVVV